jgi:S-disulfanyl-L-cysteine oxidoreductase SoxD
MDDPNRRDPTRRATAGSRAARLLAAAALLALVAPLMLARQAGAQDAPGAGAPDDGWYTADQAARGRAAYLAHCARCHSPDLRARSTYISLYDYPALRGAYFWDRWEGQTAHALLLVIEHTMPLDAPFSLDGRTYAEIVAFILQQNGFVPGPRELPAAAGASSRLVGMQLERSVARPQAQAQEVGAARREPPGDDEPPPPPDPAADAPVAVEVDTGRHGWFLPSQVDHAQTVYAERCSRCHGGAMQGIGVAPSLAGDNFMERWRGEPVSDLYWVVNELMPIDDPASLLPQAAADLVALILARNGFEAGTRALPPDEAALTAYLIDREGPP